MRSSSRFAQIRDVMLIALPMLLLIGGIVWVILHFAGNAPPKSLVISTASKGSPYHRLADRYAPVFARNGIKLDVRESDGSLANFKALTTPGTGVDAGFLQGGLRSQKDAPGLVSVGRVAFEPLWVFYNANMKLERLADLAGKRVLVGPAGGGTNALATLLLGANGVTPETATLINRDLPDYVDLLDSGQADAGFLSLAAEARTVQRLLAAPNVRLMSFTNADAYIQKFPFLARLELREGVIDLGKRIPPADTTLIATTAAVLVRADTHQSLINLLAQALAEVHSAPPADGGGQAALFQRPGEFPTQIDPEFPMSEDAKRVYKTGVPFLQRYMPFWLATSIDRMLVSLVVLVPLLVPLAKLGPQLYRWRVRRRILNWYGVLKALEVKAAAMPADKAAHLAELDRIEAAVDDIPIPLGFADQHFELRNQVGTVRNRLLGRASGAPRAMATV
jgi:uncharacterized protein